MKCEETIEENLELQTQISDLEQNKLTLLGEAKALKEAIENARDTLSARVKLDSYKNPALAAVAALWIQEREVRF